MKKTFILLLAAAAAFAACQKADVATPVADDSARVVKFSANNLYSFDTKSGSAFAAGEYVSVYAGSPIYASNVKYTIGTITEHAGSLTPTVENNVIKWGAEQFGTATATKFLAIYPWAESRSIAENGTLDYDIANDEEYASYFMTAAVSKASNNANDLAVNFAFTHPFVKLSYSITAPGDDAISTVKMYNVKRTGTIAFNTGAATAADGGAISSSDAYTVSGSAGSYSTIIMPGHFNPVLKVTMRSGINYEYKLAAAQDFVAGKNYSASITISAHSATTTSRTPVSTTFTEQDWTDQAYAPSGTESYGWLYVSGTIDTENDNYWSDEVPMINIGTNEWKVVVNYDATPGDKGVKIKTSGAWNTANVYGMSSSFTITYRANNLSDYNDNNHFIPMTNSNGGNNILLGDSGYYTLYFTSPDKLKVMKGNDVELADWEQ